MEVINMILEQSISENNVYKIKGRNLILDKSLVDKYSDIICPVSEEYLIGMVNIFGNDFADDVISYRISADMAEELHEYGY